MAGVDRVRVEVGAAGSAIVAEGMQLCACSFCHRVQLAQVDAEVRIVGDALEGAYARAEGGGD